MRKISTFITCAIAANLWLLPRTEAKTIYYEDFNLCIPENVTVADLDALEPLLDMTENGFRKGEGWIWNYEADKNNGVASSMSCYTSAGKSDDWMILPAMSLDTEAPVIRWRARSCHKKFREGYKVYVLEGEAVSPDKFSDISLLFSESAENAEWNEHELDLSAYKGKTVTIAFRNDTYDSGQLYVDDIYVGSALKFTVSCDTGAFSGLPGAKEVSGTFRNSGNTAIQGFAVTLHYDGKSERKEFPERVDAGESVPFSIGEIDCIPGANTIYSLTVDADGGSAEFDHEMRTELHRFFVEEGTGTWCGWCVGGIVTMDRLERRYPENFVAVAVHANDEMTSNSYLGEMQKNFRFNSFPCCVGDRKAESSALDMPKMLDQSFSAGFEPLGLEIKGQFTDEYKSTLTATVSARFARSFLNNDRYRICVVMTEDSVHLNKATYGQSNNYAGSSEDWDGWEKKPGYIPAQDMWYRHVARSLLTPFQGEHNSLPDFISGGDTYEFTVNGEVPKSVIIRDNIKLCAIVIDSRTGRAVNAAHTGMKEGMSSVSDIPAATGEPGREEWYDLSGRRVMNPGPGIYVIRHSDGSTRKIAVR